MKKSTTVDLSTPTEQSPTASAEVDCADFSELNERMAAGLTNYLLPPAA
jgi:hypothetical protein